MEELAGVFGFVFCGGRYREEGYIGCVVEAASISGYVENIVADGKPSADTIYRRIKGVSYERLVEEYKGWIQRRFKVRGEYYVIFDKTALGLPRERDERKCVDKRIP